MSEDDTKTKKNILREIFVPVVIGLILATTQPWWWDKLLKLFNSTPTPPLNQDKLINSTKIIDERTQEGFKVGLKGCARVGDKEVECYLEVLNLENKEIAFALFGNFRPGKSTRINSGQDYLPVSVQLDGKIDDSIGYVLHFFPPEGEAQAIFKFENLESQEQIKYFEVYYRIRSKTGLHPDPKKFKPFNDIKIINEIQ